MYSHTQHTILSDIMRHDIYPVLVIAGFAYCILAIVKFMGNICSYIFGINEDKSSSIDGVFDDSEQDKIRNKRLQYLAKQAMISENMNMEAKLARQLGLTDALETDTSSGCDHNHQDLTSRNGTDNQGDDEDISLSDDVDADNEEEEEEEEDDDD